MNNKDKYIVIKHPNYSHKDNINLRIYYVVKKIRITKIIQEHLYSNNKNNYYPLEVLFNRIIKDRKGRTFFDACVRCRNLNKK